MKRPSSFSSTALSTSGAPVIGPNPKRYALLISPPYSCGTQSSFAPRSVSAVGDGFTLQPGSDPLYLSPDSHGWIVQESWWGIGSNADTVSIIEVSLNPNESRD